MHGRTVAVRQLDVALGRGRVTALMGRNGSGKSSLLWALQGGGRRHSGAVRIGDRDPADLEGADRRGVVGLLPQTATDLLYLESVDEECAAGGPGHPRAPRPAGARRRRRRPTLATCPRGSASHSPWRWCWWPSPQVVLLDEPTRGLDYAAKAALAGILRRLADEGRAVLVATHDVEFVARAADEVVVLAEGEVVSSGPVRRVVAESPAFAPQVMKVLGPPWLRVDEVVAAMETA